ncbi:MAG: HNH endonuclease signature motif containing protein [Opitutia bacterium]
MQKRAKIRVTQQSYRVGRRVEAGSIGGPPLPKSFVLSCARCGASFTRFPSRARRYPRQFCSSACSLAQKKAERRGCVNGAGYRQISIECRTVLEHRLVVEQNLGRALRPGEVVHHINGDRSDNRIENLRVIENSSAHLREHGRERWDTDDAVRLRSEGYTFKDIGKLLGAQPQTIYKRLKENGLIVTFVRKGAKRNRSVVD